MSKTLEVQRGGGGQSLTQVADGGRGSSCALRSFRTRERSGPCKTRAARGLDNAEREPTWRVTSLFETVSSSEGKRPSPTGGDLRGVLDCPACSASG